MFSRGKSQILVGALATVLFLGAFVPCAFGRTPRKFDRFGRLDCNEELARLDNYASALRATPEGRAVIVIYAGTSDTRRGEVIAHLFAIRDYLLSKRSIAPDYVILKNGGFLKHFRIDLWIIPTNTRDSIKTLIDESVPLSTVHLQTPPVREWRFPCLNQ